MIVTLSITKCSTNSCVNTLVLIEQCKFSQQKSHREITVDVVASVNSVNDIHQC